MYLQDLIPSRGCSEVPYDRGKPQSLVMAGYKLSPTHIPLCPVYGPQLEAMHSHCYLQLSLGYYAYQLKTICCSLGNQL